MNLKALIEGTLVLVFGLVAMLEGLRLITRKDPYVLYDPLGPGVYILVLSLGLMAVSVFHFVANHRKSPGKGKVAASKKMRIQLFSSIGILVLYILLVQFVGYVVATLTFFFLELRVSGVKSWRNNVILTLMFTVVYYFIFVKFCDMIFPKGLLF
jgi:putative tricarboxylic transport membrane protein